MRSRALPDGAHGKSALRAALGQRRIRAAVVAAQAPCGLMHGQARIALAARRRPAAGSAQERRRIAAAIEEDQHLALRAQMAPDGLDGGSRNARLHGIDAQIDEPEARRLRLRRAPRQRQPLIAPGERIVQRLKCGRRRTQHDRHAGALRAHDGKIARRVAKAALVLFERGVVLLVDDDEAESRHAARRRPSACRARCARGR